MLSIKQYITIVLSAYCLFLGAGINDIVSECFQECVLEAEKTCCELKTPKEISCCEGGEDDCCITETNSATWVAENTTLLFSVIGIAESAQSFLLFKKHVSSDRFFYTARAHAPPITRLFLHNCMWLI